MASPNDTNNTQGATATTGFKKPHLKSLEPEHSLEATFARAFNEERLCTMKIKTNSGTIRVHKSVICLTSPVIAKAMEGQFLEAQENCFDLSYEDPENVSRLVQFCYLSRYDTVERTQHSESDLALTKDEGGIIRYIGDTAVQSPAILLRGQTRPGQDRGASFGRDSSLPVRDSIQLQVKDTQESAKSSALILNAKRLSLDVSMWAMGDIYDIQHLKSYAVSQLNTRLLALQKYGSPPSLILDIIHPIYECTTGKKKDLRVMLVQALRRFKKAIGMDPLLRSHFDALTKSNNDLMTDLVDDWLDIP